VVKKLWGWLPWRWRADKEFAAERYARMILRPKVDARLEARLWRFWVRRG
jgi:hypothetical protein